MLNPELLKILACPKCLGDISLTVAADGLVCPKCSLVYPVREDIPILLPEQAVKLDDWTGSRPLAE